MRGHNTKYILWGVFGVCALLIASTLISKPSETFTFEEAFERTKERQRSYLEATAELDKTLVTYNAPECREAIKKREATLRQMFDYYNRKAVESYAKTGVAELSSTDNRQIEIIKQRLDRQARPLQIACNAGIPIPPLSEAGLKDGYGSKKDRKRSTSTRGISPKILGSKPLEEPREKFFRDSKSPPEERNYLKALYARGQLPSCGYNVGPLLALPGMGADLLMLGGGTEAYVYDLGDQEAGATLEYHDKIIVEGAANDWAFSRQGHTLLMCNDKLKAGVVISRQFCQGDGWNNAIEAIYFKDSGLNYLTTDLLNKIPAGEVYMSQERGKFLALSRAAQTNWRTEPLPDALLDEAQAAQDCSKHPRELTQPERDKVKRKLNKYRG